MTQKYISKMPVWLKKVLSFFVYEIVKKRLLKPLSDKYFIALDFFLSTGKWPNYNNPVTFPEKIQWIKVFGNLEKYGQYVDKYMVREFIKNTIGEEYLIPLIGVYKNFDEINFEKLPKRFVLKATHGQGYNFICKDKNRIDKVQLKRLVNGWLEESFYEKTREKQYKVCIPRIVVEEYLEDETGGLSDYKIFCFGGKPNFIYMVLDRFQGMKYDFLDLDWNKLKITYSGYPNVETSLKKPKQLSELIEIATKLSKDFPFVRVDLYLVKGRIYFGELTFTPDNGLHEFDPSEDSKRFGDMINLSGYLNQ